MSQPRATKIIITLFIITFSTLTVPNMLTQNLIGDEAVYITEGDRYLHEPYSFYYNSGSPHLLKSLTALFYYTLPLKRNYQPYYDQNHTNVYTVAQFIYDQNTPYATNIIQRARIPHLILAIITGILIFLFTQKYTQTKTALIALALYTFHPSILAHAATANLDLGATAFIFFAIIAYFHTIQKYNQKHNTHEQKTKPQNKTNTTQTLHHEQPEKNYNTSSIITTKNSSPLILTTQNTNTTKKTAANLKDTKDNTSKTILCARATTKAKATHNTQATNDTTKATQAITPQPCTNESCCKTFTNLFATKNNKPSPRNTTAPINTIIRLLSHKTRQKNIGATTLITSCTAQAHKMLSKNILTSPQIALVSTASHTTPTNHPATTHNTSPQKTSAENSTTAKTHTTQPQNNTQKKTENTTHLTAKIHADTPPAIPDPAPENSKKNHQSHTARWILYTGILIGLAQLTKISAILLYPFIFITGAIYLKKNKLSIPLTITTISIATIITLYGFQTGPIITHHDDPAGIESLYGSIPLINQYKNTITNILRMPIFPAGAYLNNFTYQLTHSFYGHTIYLNGIFTDQGLWYFIPILFLYKNSIMLLIALIITLVACFKCKRYKNQLITYLTIWCAIITLWSVTSKLQLGIRYILPIFPPLFIIIADALTNTTKSARKLSIIIALYAISTLSMYPNYFTYTQELLRFQNPLNLIADSDYDWGQSVYKLGYVQKEKNLYPLYFTQSGGASQAYYGIKSQKNADTAFMEKQSGYYAFSHSAIIGFKKTNPPLFNYFITQKPYSTIDNTIYVYQITF